MNAAAIAGADAITAENLSSNEFDHVDESDLETEIGKHLNTKLLTHASRKTSREYHKSRAKLSTWNKSSRSGVVVQSQEKE